MRRQWINNTPSEELSVYNFQQTTNYGAEIDHGKLKKTL